MKEKMNTKSENFYDFVIVHGSFGWPFENWFPWLADELAAKGKKVLAPQFPCGKGMQNYENWYRVLDAYAPFIGEKTTFIGHSLAPAFIVDYLLDRQIKVNALYFVAPLYQKCNHPEVDEVNASFFFKSDLKDITTLSQKRICFISTNDPYVPNDYSLDFAKKIGAEVKTVENAGHFNTAAGYRTFPLLLQQLSEA